MTDPISDLLTRIRNGQKARLPEVGVPHSRIKESIVEVLKREGYVQGFAVDGTLKKTIKVRLKYDGRRGVIEGLRRVSRPGLRRYVDTSAIPRVRGGLGVAILSTPQGVMSGIQARKRNTGGEVLCYVW